MKFAWLLAMLAAATGLGLWLGWRFLRRQRNPPVHAAVHLLLGGAALEGFVILRRGAPDGTVLPFEGLGNTAALLLVGAMLTGLAAPLVAQWWGRRPVGVVLAAHAAAGLAGAVALVTWILRN